MLVLRVGILVSALLTVPIAAQAQEPDPAVAVGDRVRLTTTIFEYPVEGPVLDLDDASVTVWVDDIGAFRAPRTEILGAEVEVGRGPRRVVRTALVGATVLGALSFLMDPGDCGHVSSSGSIRDCTRGEIFLVGTVSGALLGVALGLWTNSLWAPVTLGVSPSALLPGRLDLGVAVALSLRAPHWPAGR